MASIQALAESAKTYEGDLVAFLQDLVRIRSVNGRESESAVAARIAAEADKLGFERQLAAADPDRPNVLVRWGMQDHAFALIGHMDTVSEGEPQGWACPPFSAVIVNGKIFGRGTADNKAGIACGLYAMALLRDQNLLDPAQCGVILAGVVDEESGASSPFGVRYLLDSGELRAQGAIYAYASHIICVGHRGLVRLIVRVEGKSIHSGSPVWILRKEGANAVTGLAAILVALEQLHMDAPPHPAFAGQTFTITPGTLMRGGEFESMVPAHAEALIDLRLMPGQAADDVIAAVQQVVDSVLADRPGLRVSIEVKNRVPGAAIPVDHPLALIARQHAEALTGRQWITAGAGPANEGYMLIEAGIPTLCGFGPEGGNTHAPNEWVDIASMTRTVAMYASVVKDYLSDSTS